MNANSVKRALVNFNRRIRQNKTSGFFLLEKPHDVLIYHAGRWGSPTVGVAPLQDTTKPAKTSLSSGPYELFDGYMLEGNLWLRFCNITKGSQDSAIYWCSRCHPLVLVSDHNLKTHLESVMGGNIPGSSLDFVTRMLELDDDIADNRPSLILKSPDYDHYGCW